jgi:DNA-binding CsgD family transcriptional regulator
VRIAVIADCREVRIGRELARMRVQDRDTPFMGSIRKEEYLTPGLETGLLAISSHYGDRKLIWSCAYDRQRRVDVGASAGRVLAKSLTATDPVKVERQRCERPTDREREVLRFIADGFSAPEIAGKPFMSPRTVDTYKQRIHEKIGLGHRADYVKHRLNMIVRRAGFR